MLYKKFRDGSIKTKLMLLMMCIVLFSTISTSLVFTYRDLQSTKQSLINELTLVSGIVGKRSVPTLQFDFFNGKKNAEKNLFDLSSKKSVVKGCIFQKGGSLFAQFIQQKLGVRCDVSMPMGSIEKGGFLYIHEVIRNNKDEKIGSIQVIADLNEVNQQLVNSVVQTSLIIFAIITLSYFLTSKIQQLISGPIIKLNNMTEKVASGDYTVYVEKESSDEIGFLAESFNMMISQIERRDATLKEYSETLEEKVEERTAELATSNAQLEDSYKELEVTLERLRVALNKEKHFVNKMSHEIRTPIHQVVFNLSSLIMGWSENKESDRIEMVGSSLYATQRLQRLLESVLDFEKAREGRRTYYIRECSLERMLADVGEELYHEMAQKAIIFEIVVPHDMSDIICDMTKIEQVVRNILGNAIKYSDEGRIILQAKKTEHEGEEAVVISISDTGVGVPEDEIDAIFSPFVESSRTETKEKGTGLGLAICQEIIDAHRGVITVRNNPDQGATFSFTIPTSQEEGGIFKWSAAASDEKDTVEGMVKEAKRVLDRLLKEAEKAPEVLASSVEAASDTHERNLVVVADDDPLNLRPLITTVRKAGYEVASFEDGMPAWEYIHKHAANIYMVFLDNMMPHMYGIEVARRMKKLDETQDIPIVIQSGAVEEKSLPEGSIWMRKPYMPRDVISALEGNYQCPVEEAKQVQVRVEGVPIEGVSVPSSATKKHVIYADDDAATMKMVVKMIEREGYVVHTFSQGVKVWEYIEAHKDEIGIVLLDENMPQMKGSEVAGKMLADATLQSIPIVLQTGSDDEVIGDDVITKVHKLQKPYLPPDVIKVINEKIT